MKVNMSAWSNSDQRQPDDFPVRRSNSVYPVDILQEMTDADRPGSVGTRPCTNDSYMYPSGLVMESPVNQSQKKSAPRSIHPTSGSNGGVGAIGQVLYNDLQELYDISMHNRMIQASVSVVGTLFVIAMYVLDIVTDALLAATLKRQVSKHERGKKINSIMKFIIIIDHWEY